MQRILVLGAGFAGLWAAAGAARRLAQAKALADAVEVRVVDPRTVHSVRVRNYELDLAATTVPLADVFEPIGVQWLQGKATRIDTARQEVQVDTADGSRTLGYARLVVALGSRLLQPPIPGLAEHSFDVDSCEAAEKLRLHLAALPLQPDAPGRFSAVVVGAGLTGVEIAAELPGRLAALAGAQHQARVVLMDHGPRIAGRMGEAQPVIETAMQALGVELRPGVKLRRVTRAGLELEGGETIAASTVVWCGGMRAHPLVAQLGLPGDRLDAFGRVPVDDCLRVEGVPGVYAAGDSACSLIDGTNPSIMSCQYARPMGRFAGHNAAADLLGEPLLPLRIDWYVTCVDLGPWGAVYTEGRERRLAAQGEQAKRTKRLINRERIPPPRTRERQQILDAAAPVVQGAPPKHVAAAG